jgi:hypothetical protein
LVSSQSEPDRLQAHGFVKILHDMICKICAWCLPGCGACDGKLAGATLCCKFQQIGMRQTASAFSCGGAGASPRGIIHYTDDHHCCHSDHWQEAAHRTAQQNRDSTRNSCGLLCPYRFMPRGFYTESSRCSDISSPLRRTPNRILGRLVATVAFQLRSLRPLPISPTLSAADLTEIWARCTRC